MDTLTTKRGPGRPSKKKSVVKQRFGRSDKPNSTGNILEMVFDISDVFKDIASLCKLYSVHELTVYHLLDRTYIIIEKTEHTAKIEICFPSDKLFFYYVEEPYAYIISILELEKVFNSIKKTATRHVVWCANNKTQIHLRIEYVKDIKLGIDGIIATEHLRIDITPINYIPYSQIDDNIVDMSFCVTSAFFKTKVTTIKKISEGFRFERMSKDSIAMVYSSKTGKLNSNIKLSGAINLVDNLEESRIHVLPINIPIIESFIAASLSPDINIKFIHDNNIIFMYNLYDGIAIIKLELVVTNAS